MRAGASVTIAFEEGGEPPRVDGGVRWLPIRHARVGGSEVPLGFEEVLREADLLVMHSGWTLYNIFAGALARKLRVPYLLEPRGAYDPHIVSREKLLKKMWWAAAEKELVTQVEAIL